MLSTNHTTRIRRAAAILAVLAFAGLSTTVASAQNYQLKIQNRSGITIERVYVSSSADPNWHGDRLVGTLPTGWDLDVPRVPAVYDLKLVDDDGDVCIITGLTRSVLYLTTDSLVGCETRTLLHGEN